MSQREQMLEDHLTQNKLRLTKQRSAIVKAFLRMQPHVTAEALHNEMSRNGQSVGLATIYRTLNLLCQWGLAQQRQFGDGPTLYELHEHIHRQKHHDHLICTRCGKIIEFRNPQIEEIQKKVASQYDFIVNYHKHELYGLCMGCSRKGHGSLSKG